MARAYPVQGGAYKAVHVVVFEEAAVAGRVYGFGYVAVCVVYNGGTQFGRTRKHIQVVTHSNDLNMSPVGVFSFHGITNSVRWGDDEPENH